MKKIVLFLALILSLNGCSFKSKKIKGLESKTNREISSYEEFKFFTDKGDFEKYYNKIVKKHEPRSKVIDRNNIQYSRLNQAIESVFPYFLKRFPQIKSKIGDNIPLAVIVENFSTGFAVFAPQDSPKAFAVFANLESIESISLSELKAIVAHELTHLLLQKNSIQRSSTVPLVIYYSKVKADYSKPLSENLPLQSEINEWSYQWEEYVKYGGELSSANLLSIGWSYNFDFSTFLMSAYYYITQKTRCGDGASKNSHNLFEVMRSLYEAGGVPQLEKKLERSDRLLITKPFSVMKKRLRKCLGDTSQNFLTIVDTYFKETSPNIQYNSSKELKSYLLSIVRDKHFLNETINEFNNSTLYNAFVNMVAKAKTKMRAIESMINFQDIRKYTHEDHADEIAVLILNDMQIPFNQLFKGIGLNINECKVFPAAEPYSPISIEHHTHCWRYWRASQIVNDSK